MEKHQYGFSTMNCRTGSIKRKSFWGTGETENDCLGNARGKANDYARDQAEQAYNKARMKDRSGYAPSRSSYEFQVVGHSLWK